MQHDDVIWRCLTVSFCSYKTIIKEGNDFCRNVYNVSGLCDRKSCPLANSRYATLRENDGICYLYIYNQN